MDSKPKTKEILYEDIRDYFRERGLLSDSHHERILLEGLDENVPTMEEVRALLAVIPGSLSQQIIDDRE